MSKNIILYSACGEGHINEAFKSASFSKQTLNNKTIDIILHTDNSFNLKHKAINEKLSVFSTIVVDDNNFTKEKAYGFKFQGMIKILKEHISDKILFLDTDAWIVQQQAIEIFDLLSQFDIAAAHAQFREVGTPMTDIPKSFPEFNSGVIAFKESALKVLEECLHHFSQHTVEYHPGDQGSFRRAMYFSNVRIATLAPEYNIRNNPEITMLPKPIILHGRGKALKFFKSMMSAKNLDKQHKTTYDLYQKFKSIFV